MSPGKRQEGARRSGPYATEETKRATYLEEKRDQMLKNNRLSPPALKKILAAIPGVDNIQRNPQSVAILMQKFLKRISSYLRLA
jgi:hypothetical protein